MKDDGLVAFVLAVIVCAFLLALAVILKVAGLW